MTKGATPKRDRVVVDGAWFGLPCDFFASTACAQLSPHAMKMLTVFLGQLRKGGYGNGRLDAHPDRLEACGWTSVPTARAAIRELIDANLIVCTRRGVKGRIGLYGITLMPMNCKHDDLECGPGAWTVAQWRERAGAADKPTTGRPATWHRARASEADKKRIRSPRGGTELPSSASAAEANSPENPSCDSAADMHPGDSSSDSLPRRVPPSRKPSPRPASTRIGRLLARTQHRATPAYEHARAVFHQQPA